MSVDEQALEDRPLFSSGAFWKKELHPRGAHGFFSKKGGAHFLPGEYVPAYSGKPLTFGKRAGGSNGARWAFHKDGTRWLVKAYRGDRDRVATELASNAIYRQMGARVPAAGKLRLNDGGGMALAYPTMPGTPSPYVFHDFGPSMALGRHFMTDALLANWDVAGLEDDNVLWDEEGRPFRVDQGGTLEYRAMGGKKWFGPVPVEVTTMMMPGGQAHRSMITTPDKMRRQAADIANRLPPAKVNQIIAESGFKDKAMEKRVAVNLNARVDWMRRFSRGEEHVPRLAEDGFEYGDLAEANVDWIDFKWKPEAHPRDEHGRFRQTLSLKLVVFNTRLRLGKVTVHRDKKTGLFAVTRSGKISKFANVEDAARAALDASARGTEADSLGGAHKFKDYNDYLANGHDVNPMEPGAFGGLTGLSAADLADVRGPLEDRLAAAEASASPAERNAIPTLKARLAELKDKIQAAHGASSQPQADSSTPTGAAALEKLKTLGYGPGAEFKMGNDPKTYMVIPAEHDGDLLVASKEGGDNPLIVTPEAFLGQLSGAENWQLTKGSEVEDPSETPAVPGLKVGDTIPSLEAMDLASPYRTGPRGPRRFRSAKRATTTVEDPSETPAVPGLKVGDTIPSPEAMDALPVGTHVGFHVGAGTYVKINAVPGFPLTDTWQQHPSGSLYKSHAFGFSGGNIIVTALPEDAPPATAASSPIDPSDSFANPSVTQLESDLLGLGVNNSQVLANGTKITQGEAKWTVYPTNGVGKTYPVAASAAHAALSLDNAGSTPAETTKSLPTHVTASGLTLAGETTELANGTKITQGEAKWVVQANGVGTAAQSWQVSIPGKGALTYTSAASAAEAANIGKHVGDGTSKPLKLIKGLQPNQAMIKTLHLEPGDVIQMGKGKWKNTVIKANSYGGSVEVKGPKGNVKGIPGYVAPAFIQKASGQKLTSKEDAAASGMLPPEGEGAASGPTQSVNVVDVALKKGDILKVAPVLTAAQLKTSLKSDDAGKPLIGALPDGAVISTPAGQVGIVKPGEDAYDGYVAAYDVETGAKFEPPKDKQPIAYSTDPDVMKAAAATLAKAQAPSTVKVSGTSSAGSVTQSGPPPAFDGIPAWHQAEAILKALQQSAPIPAAASSAVQSYSGSSYSEINSYLRNSQAVATLPTAHKAAKIEQAILSAPAFDQDVIIGRKTSLPAWQNAQPGQAIRDNGFLSCSTDQNTWSGNVHLKILAKKGTRGLILNPTTGSNHSSENEVLLKNGTQFEVLKREEKGNGVILYVETIVPEAFT